MKLSIVIPLYNEQLIIKKNLEKIYNHFSDKLDFEIIVVNDGSIDNSLNIIKNIKFKNINIIDIQNNLGKGNAIKQGILSSHGKIVLITDADLSTSIDQYATLYNKYLEGFDIVIGSRSTEDAKISKKQNILRICAGKIFNLCVKNILKLDFKDTQCGFKLFNGKNIRKVMSQSIIKRFCIDVEILYLAKKFKLKVYEVGINWENNTDSSVHLLRDSINMFIDLLRIKFNNYKIE